MLPAREIFLGFSVIAVAAIGVKLTAKTASKPRLKYFKASEFGVWLPFMSNELLLKLDEFREQWGAPVEISGAVGGIGRKSLDSHSQHNVLKWGEVRAIDLFPKVEIADGIYGYIDNGEDLRRAQQIAVQVGFTGIGVYTDTQPGYMLHVDVREDREFGDVALWSRIDGDYLGIEQAYV